MYLLGGLPLAWFYRFVNTADAMIGYRNERFEYLGKFAALLDDVLNWAPARITGLVIVFASVFTLHNGRIDLNNVRRAWKVMRHQGGATESPNAGIPMSAAAGVLGIVLEKIDNYRLVGGDDLPTPGDIASAIQLIRTAAALWVVVCGLVIGSVTYVV